MKDFLSNPYNGKAVAIMKELCLLIRKGKLEVTKLQHHKDTHGAMNLEVNTRLPDKPTRRRKR